MQQTIARNTSESARFRLPVWSARSAIKSRSSMLELALFSAIFLGFGWFLARFVSIPVTGTDGGNLLAISRPILHGDFDFLINTQGPPLTAVVYAALLPNGDWLPLNLLSLVPALILASGLAFFVFHYTRSLLLASVPVLVLGMSPIFWTQNTSLSPYAAFTGLAYAGVYYMCSYALGHVRLRTGLIGALLLAASLYTFGQALAFFAIPALSFLVLSPKRETLKRLLPLYAALAATTLPWGIWHLLVGGISNFEDYPLNWLNQNYPDYVNDFWGRTYYGSPFDYLEKVASVLKRDLLPGWTLPALVIGIFATWQTYGWRSTLFACLALAILCAPVMIRMSPVFARYWYSCLPILALLITVGVGYCMQRLPSPVQVAVFGLVALGLFAQIETSSNAAYNWNVTRHHEMNQDLRTFARVIDDSRGVISRDSRIQSMAPDNAMFNNVTLNEQDMVAYLSWNSDTEVNEVFRRQGIGWVLLYNNSKTWELNYNRWLEAATGKQPSHYIAIESSGLVDQVYRGREMTLYRIKPFTEPAPEVQAGTP